MTCACLFTYGCECECKYKCKCKYKHKCKRSEATWHAAYLQQAMAAVMEQLSLTLVRRLILMFALICILIRILRPRLRSPRVPILIRAPAEDSGCIRGKTGNVYLYLYLHSDSCFYSYSYSYAVAEQVKELV